MMKIDQFSNDPIHLQQNEVLRAEKTQQGTAPRSVAGYALELGGGGNTILGDRKKGREVLPEEGTQADAKNSRDMMTLMAHTMSPEAYGEMQKEGLDPCRMDPEDVVNSADRIKATMAQSGVVIAGYNDDLTSAQLEQITGSAAYAQEIEHSFREYGVPLNEENAKEAADFMEKTAGLQPLSEGAKAYLVENELPTTADNVYLAEHSGAVSRGPRGAVYLNTNGYLGRTGGADAAGMEQLRGQMERLIERAGESVDEENLAIARRLTQEGLPLTEESFLAMKELDGIELPLSTQKAAETAARALSDGLHPAQADLSREESLLEEAQRLTQTVQELPDEAADAVVQKDLPLNIKNLSREAAEADLTSFRMEASIQITMESRTITARRQLQEVRLSMTVQVSYQMLKAGVNVDTLELSDLVDRMKAAEQEMLGSRFNTNDADVARQRSAVYQDTMDTLRQLPSLPVSVLGEFLQSGQGELSISSSFSVTMEEYAEAGRSRMARYTAAGERYETMATEVRRDLGDSISKAFAGAQSLLEELGIEADEDNLRATRILGYNSMEVTQTNIDRVKDAYHILDDITQRMTPESTLQMIRDGKNPIKMGMDELDAYLEQAQPQGESYSEFLVRMEQKNRITTQERESYIGIYRMLHQVNSRDGAAIGSVLQQDRELNFENLLTAVRSRRDAGLDVRVDDELQGMNSTVQGDIEEQIATAMYKETVADMKEAAEAPLSVYEELLQSGLQPTAEQLQGLRGLRERRGELFELSRRAVTEPHRRQHTTADGRIVSERESSGGSDALSVTEDILDAAIRDSLERFDSKESAQEAYSHMADVAQQALAEAALREDGSIDLKAIASAMKQLGTARALSDEEHYEIPVRIHGEETAVSVSIRHEEGVQGQVEIRMESVVYGNLRAGISAEEAGLNIFAVTDSHEGREAAAQLQELLRQRYEDAQIAVTEINFAYSSHPAVNISTQKADDSSEGFDTAILYRSAKIFLQTLGEA